VAGREEGFIATAVTSVSAAQFIELCSPIDGILRVFGVLRRAALVTNDEPSLVTNVFTDALAILFISRS
jgi:hypothetical protein